MTVCPEMSVSNYQTPRRKPEVTQPHGSVGGGAVGFFRDVPSSDLIRIIACFLCISWNSSAIPGDYPESAAIRRWTFHPEADHLAVSSVIV